MQGWATVSLCCAMFLWSGGAMAQAATDVECTACVHTDDIAVGAVTTNKIANGGVRTADLGANSITSGKIKDGAIEFADLSASIQQYVNATIAEVVLAAAYLEDDGSVGVTCPAGRVPLSASCGCSNEGGTRNFGVLEACEVVGDGVVASCLNDALTYNALLPAPLAQATAICIGGDTNDGTPWVPTLEGAGGSIAFESALSAMRARRAEYENLLLKRAR